MFVSNVGLISNATFGVQQNSNTMLGQIRSAGSSSDPSALSNSETKLTASNLNNETAVNAWEMMDKSQKKVQDENIKRSFSTFA